jgi:hypothetical protein
MLCLSKILMSSLAIDIVTLALGLGLSVEDFSASGMERYSISVLCLRSLVAHVES